MKKEVLTMLEKVEEIKSVLNDVIVTEDCYSDITPNCLHCSAVKAFEYLDEIENLLRKSEDGKDS